MTRLALFAALLVAVLAGAAGVGRAVGPIERGAEEPEVSHAKPAKPDGAHAAEPVGLSLAANGFRFAPVSNRVETGPTTFAFRILGARRFDVVHERRMHLVVVRRDLTVFRHVHPRQRADGTWAVELDLPTPGVYRAFADFSAGGKRTVVGVDLFASGSPRAETGVRHRLEPRMSRVGDTVRFEVGPTLPYLGARGHLVVLREGDLAYVHAHPESDELAFELELPTPGRYRLFLQWRNDRGVETQEFRMVQR